MKQAPLAACCGGPQRPMKLRGPANRLGRALGWLTPGAVLVLMPKCPVCVAGYVAMLTGFGISLTTAAIVRFTLFFLCLAALTFMAWKRARQSPAPGWFHRRPAK